MYFKVKLKKKKTVNYVSVGVKSMHLTIELSNLNMQTRGTEEGGIGSWALRNINLPIGFNKKPAYLYVLRLHHPLKGEPSS